MANGCATAVFRQVARVFQEGTLAGRSDGEILNQFVERRDETAFELLLRRHGPMVRNVCRQTLFDPHEAEDAFQATFLALICKASSLRVEGSLGPWLYRVASRIAARARAERRRRTEREVSCESLPEPSSREDPDRGEISRVVHEELGRLPDRLRAPMVLCYLEGMTHELAAGHLRCPVGTVRSRLARARALLQRRITRRGIATSTATMAAALESTSRAAALPPPIARSMIKVAAQFASGSASIRSGVGVSASVAVLMEGVLNVMRIKKLVGLGAALAAVGTLGVVVAVSAFPAAGQTGYRLNTRLQAKVMERDIGPDGRPIGSRREQPTPETIVKTYYVGDIIKPKPHGPGDSDRRWVDMTPLIRLITSVVARGSWKVVDGDGTAITSQYVRPGPDQGDASSKPLGQITPFFLSISLIVRHTPEVHKEVAELLRGLRRLLDSKERVPEEEEEERLGAPPRPHPTDPKPVAVGSSNAKPAATRPIEGEALVPRSLDKRARIQQLLDELRQEVEKLPKDHE